MFHMKHSYKYINLDVVLTFIMYITFFNINIEINQITLYNKNSFHF